MGSGTRLCCGSLSVLCQLREPFRRKDKNTAVCQPHTCVPPPERTRGAFSAQNTCVPSGDDDDHHEPTSAVLWNRVFYSLSAAVQWLPKLLHPVTHIHPHVPRFPPLFLSPHHAPLPPSLPLSSSFLSCGFLPLHHRLSASSPFSPRPDGSQMRVSFCLETVMKTEILFPGWLLWVFSAVLRCCRVIDVAVVVLVSHFGLIDVSARIGADISNDFQLAHSSSWGKVNSFQPNCCRSPTSWRFHAAIISKAVTLFASAYFILRNVHSFLFQSTTSPQTEQFTNVVSCLKKKNLKNIFYLILYFKDFAVNFSNLYLSTFYCIVTYILEVSTLMRTSFYFVPHRLPLPVLCFIPVSR